MCGDTGRSGCAAAARLCVVVYYLVVYLILIMDAKARKRRERGNREPVVETKKGANGYGNFSQH